ncbi:MAG: GMC family oxidoreductase [Flavobacteriaceae bacterium TMED68]|nr:MAG: GMC family oxidoreductase [Flavobacteriaceae bacterium TMED68]|tara:strand:- start:12301 stop:13992 length:1692 start_codon:yes stop_codon:yes gene_type:complete
METKFDAIVIGTGISGGWAAKELCEKGLKTLVLERGRMIKHIEDYTTMNDDPWDYKNGDVITQEIKRVQPKQSRTDYVNSESTKHFFVNDLEHPYKEEKPFNWIRGYHVGGRSLLWARHTYRLTDFDFNANLKEGIAIDWPIRYKDIAPWYDYVERYIGISGKNENLPHFPNGIYLKPMELNCAEEILQKKVNNSFDDRIVSNARIAHITEGTKPGLGRVSCQYRNRCRRGCPYGAYFSSNSSTLPAAELTGNMTLKPNSLVHEIIYDKNLRKATGVRVIDSNTKEVYDYKAKVIFLCASTVGSTSILMQSISERFPNGMGNDSGELGHNLMDHHFQVGADAIIEGIEEKYYVGRKPAGFYIPRFRNLGGNTNKKNYTRGYGYQGDASRGGVSKNALELGYGSDFKRSITKPGDWSIGMQAFGEILPYHENKMYLDQDDKDSWGLPKVVFDAEIKENELNMRKDMMQQAIEMFEAAGAKEIVPYDKKYIFGNGIHEMGTARMGNDSKKSVLNKHNQIHAVKNVYVTDGSCMTSSGNANPSLTYMALTARAVKHAIQELNKKNL